MNELYTCTIDTCGRTTRNPFKKNPRFRWIVKLILHDDAEDKDYEVTLCPKHVKELLHVDEEFFRSMERTEKFIRTPGLMPTDMIQ